MALRQIRFRQARANWDRLLFIQCVGTPNRWDPCLTVNVSRSAVPLLSISDDRRFFFPVSACSLT